MKLLVEQNGAKVNIFTQGNETALCIACERKNVKMVEYLMANGADPNLQNATGFTGLLHACQRNETKIAKLLLAHNADPNLRNIAGYTALVWASINQNMELVTELLHHSADPNVPVLTNSRYTALTWAMIKSNIDVTKKLLYHGADPYLQVNDGKTSFDYLNDSQRGEVISYFDRCTRWYRRKAMLMFLVCSSYLPLKKDSLVAYPKALKYEKVLSNIHLVQIICTYL
jgi:ankyrin repeat protein